MPRLRKYEYWSIAFAAGYDTPAPCTKASYTNVAQYPDHCTPFGCVRWPMCAIAQSAARTYGSVSQLGVAVWFPTNDEWTKPSRPSVRTSRNQRFEE